MITSVLQPWLESISLMQQSVLLAGLRAPDTLPKTHPAKLLMRWYRRCILISAFDGRVLERPWEPGGGSFAGPLYDEADGQAKWGRVNRLREHYLKNVDEIPHHFHLHLIHGAEILGYKHPDTDTRHWWYEFYSAAVNDMHLQNESCTEMDERLGDNERAWRERENYAAGDE